MMPLEFSGRWVVITGASSGLGAAIARRLARDHEANLILVARRVELLESLQDEIESHHGTRVIPLVVDLARSGAADEVFEKATAGHDVLALVSNAAAHDYGRFDALSPETADRILAVNTRTPTLLLRRFLPYMLERGEGGVLVVTSAGALLPTPYQALYGATKSMMQDLVQSIHHEFRDQGSPIAISSCCPAGIDTDMLQASEVGDRVMQSPLQLTVLSADEVAREAIDGLRVGHFRTTPRAWIKGAVAAYRCLPDYALGRLAARVYRP